MTRRRAVTAAALGIAAGVTGRVFAADARAQRTSGGDAWRLRAQAGVVRVYRPRGYREADAALVVYVHGLYTDVDRAWREHDLPAQFRASRRNALFVVAPGRQAPPDEPPWPSIDALTSAVAASTGLAVPTGPLTIAGHSGAYSQLAVWLADARVRRVLLLDGLYGRSDEFRAWLDLEGYDHRMAMIGHDTRAAAEAWAHDIPYAIRAPKLRRRYDDLPPAARDARLLVADTDADHMAIIRDGWALPLLLRWARLPAR